MRRFLYAMIVTVALALGAAPAIAEKRVALLIGNKDYALDKLDLKNPHNDIAHVAAALKKVGFEVTAVKDAGLGKLQISLRRYTRKLRRAGSGAIGFFYYSGHGALNEDTRTNYLIPVDVKNIDSEELWDSSVRLRRVIDELKSQAGNAQHFVVFDACRNSLQLASKTSKSLLQSKGFKAEREVRGMLISYATAEGKIASDAGDNVGPYASALAAEIVKPGVEAVAMFRKVQLTVQKAINQEPWLTYGALRETYFAEQNQAVESEKPEPAGSSSALEQMSKRLAALEAELKAAKSKPDKDEQKVAVGVFPDKAKAAPKREPFEPEMVRIPGGSFEMGCVSGKTCTNREKPVHRITIKAFEMGKYEVTFDEWDACVAGGGCGGYKPAGWGWGRGKRPVINVSWDDAQSYVKWLSGETGKTYRLLSEAEWEYAARAGTRAAYAWGNSIGKNKANCDGCDSRWDNKKTAIVGSFKPNRFGLYDMHGNVWELTKDCWHKNYKGAPKDGSVWLSANSGDCAKRVLRGGSWNNEPQDLRSAYRNWNPSGTRYDYYGFRIARTLD